jgi:subtilisin family serine protease
MSLGGPKSAALNAAVVAATNAHVTVVMAAGNSNSDARNFSPSSAPSGLVVAAIDKTDTKAPFSNFGPRIDIWAPGVDILSTSKDSDTAVATMKGTSMGMYDP